MIGDLNRRVALQMSLDIPDRGGSVSLTWQTFATVWASMEPAAGDRPIGPDKVDAKLRWIMRVRFRDDVSTGCRVLWGSRVFDVKRVANEDQRGRFLVVTLDEVDPK